MPEKYRLSGGIAGRLALSLAMLLPAAPCWSDREISRDILAQPWFREFQRELRAAWVAPSVATSGRVAFVAGSGRLHSGDRLKSGNDWLALACVSGRCRLAPARLAVNDVDATPDHPPMRQLDFHAALTPEEHAVAWFRTDSALAWLRAGEVATYHDGSRPPRAARGSEEARVALPGGARADFVPVLAWQPDRRDDEKAENEAETEDEAEAEDETKATPPVLLQLRADGKRQWLPGLLDLDAFDSDASRYLSWAGDLDGDGRADYLVRFTGGTGAIHLYLSSLAKAGKLVGLAGVYNGGRKPAEKEKAVSE
jgi:hypothetical protein